MSGINLWIDREHPVKACQSLNAPILVMQHVAPVQRGCRVIRVGPNSFTECAGCLLDTIQFAQNTSKVIEGVGLAGIDQECSGQAFECFRVAPKCGQDVAAKLQRLGMCRIKRIGEVQAVQGVSFPAKLMAGPASGKEDFGVPGVQLFGAIKVVDRFQRPMKPHQRVPALEPHIRIIRINADGLIVAGQRQFIVPYRLSRGGACHKNLDVCGHQALRLLQGNERLKQIARLRLDTAQQEPGRTIVGIIA